MKYVEPEMEIVEWDAKVVTDLTNTSVNEDPWDLGGM